MRRGESSVSTGSALDLYFFLFHRHINYVLILNFVKRSTSFVVHIRPWIQEHIQAFVSTFVYFLLFFFKYEYLYVHEASFLGVL